MVTPVCSLSGQTVGGSFHTIQLAEKRKFCITDTISISRDLFVYQGTLKSLEVMVDGQYLVELVNESKVEFQLSD